MQIVDATELGRTVIGKYKEAKVNVKVEAKDLDFDLFLPVLQAEIDSSSSEIRLSTNDSSEAQLKASLNEDAQYASLGKEDKRCKQTDAFVAKLVEERQRWIGDSLLAAGLSEPNYTMLGMHGSAATAGETYAEHLAKLHQLMVFDTNVFMRHLFSNYLRLRLSTSSNVNAATVPGVVWELEDIANRTDNREQARIARSAFRDVAKLQSFTKCQVISARELDIPSDRLIRQQVRDFHWGGVQWTENGKTYGTETKIFVTFDRVSALAAQAEGMVCTSLDSPVGGPTWHVKPIGSESLEETVGSFCVELAITAGVVKVGKDDDTVRISGDWAGKSNMQWINGKVRLE